MARTSPVHAPRGRGRPSSATPGDVLAAGMRHYLRGERLDVKEIAAELGLGRATIYRWFGSRESLIGEILIRLVDWAVASARKRTRTTGAAGLLETFDRYNRTVAGRPLRAFIEREGKVGLRIIASGSGKVQPHVIALVRTAIEAEMRARRYRPTIEPSTLAYAIVRLGEAFLFNDAVAGIRGDVDRLREVQAALLGVTPARRR
jgi:AcrR family transcriptional regulator